MPTMLLVTVLIGGGGLRGRRMIWWQAREKSWY